MGTESKKHYKLGPDAESYVDPVSGFSLVKDEVKPHTDGIKSSQFTQALKNGHIMEADASEAHSRSVKPPKGKKAAEKKKEEEDDEEEEDDDEDEDEDEDDEEEKAEKKAKADKSAAAAKKAKEDKAKK